MACFPLKPWSLIWDFLWCAMCTPQKEVSWNKNKSSNVRHHVLLHVSANVAGDCPNMSKILSSTRLFRTWPLPKVDAASWCIRPFTQSSCSWCNEKTIRLILHKNYKNCVIWRSTPKSFKTNQTRALCNPFKYAFGLKPPLASAHLPRLSKQISQSWAPPFAKQMKGNQQLLPAITQISCSCSFSIIWIDPIHVVCSHLFLARFTPAPWRRTRALGDSTSAEKHLGRSKTGSQRHLWPCHISATSLHYAILCHKRMATSS